ncbi:MAG: hypothetical protein JWQ09_1560 [Segetibacter sp.]|nr:hypothetical protein [Segetibacter sp.]
MNFGCRWDVFQFPTIGNTCSVNGINEKANVKSHLLFQKGYLRNRSSAD